MVHPQADTKQMFTFSQENCILVDKRTPVWFKARGENTQILTGESFVEVSQRPEERDYPKYLTRQEKLTFDMFPYEGLLHGIDRVLMYTKDVTWVKC